MVELLLKAYCNALIAIAIGLLKMYRARSFRVAPVCPMLLLVLAKASDQLTISFSTALSTFTLRLASSKWNQEKHWATFTSFLSDADCFLQPNRVIQESPLAVALQQTFTERIKVATEPS